MRLFIFLISLSICVYADEVELSVSQDNTTKTKYEQILKKLKVKINKFINPGKTKTTVAVIGVRGNKYDSKKNIYWKTELSQKAKDKIKEEGQIVEKLIQNFDPTKSETVVSIEEYIKKNPNSYFIEELSEVVKSTATVINEQN